MGRRPNPIPHERRLVSLPKEEWARLKAEAAAAGVGLNALVAGKILSAPASERTVPGRGGSDPATTSPTWTQAAMDRHGDEPDYYAKVAAPPVNRLRRVVDTPWTPHPKPGVKR